MGFVGWRGSLLSVSQECLKWDLWILWKDFFIRTVIISMFLYDTLKSCLVIYDSLNINYYNSQEENKTNAFWQQLRLHISDSKTDKDMQWSHATQINCAASLT